MEGLWHRWAKKLKPYQELRQWKAWFLVAQPLWARASSSARNCCRNRTKAMAGTVLSIQELSGDFGGLFPGGAEYSKHRAKGTCDFPHKVHVISIPQGGKLMDSPEGTQSCKQSNSFPHFSTTCAAVSVLFISPSISHIWRTPWGHLVLPQGTQMGESV
jgi:hypothetical protein